MRLASIVVRQRHGDCWTFAKLQPDSHRVTRQSSALHEIGGAGFVALGPSPFNHRFQN